ncbi:MAG: extracellular solute-binding protein [Deltaproteobacteria bacterium]|nr:extracellular solute-binding protein [Deltaproteobacteria bacterium]
MRRSAGAAALLVLTALAVCPPAAGRAQETTTLRVWHAYGQGSAEETALRQAADAYVEAHPDQRVELLANAFGAYLSKLESAIPTGNGPDLFIDAHERVTHYVERRLITPVEAPSSGRFDASQLEALSVEGRLYGVPLSLKCAALYVNTSLLPEAPSSLDALARRPHAEGVFPLVFEAENAYYVAALLHAHGGRLLDDEGGYAFVGPAAHATVAEVQRWVESGATPEEATGELAKRLFASGHALSVISGPWLAPDLPDSLPYRVLPLPPATEGGEATRPYLTIEAAYVAAQAQHPAEAAALADFLAHGPGALIRAKAGRQVVADAAAFDDPELASDAFLSTFRRAAAAALPMPTHPHMRLAFEPAGQALRKVLRTGMPIDDALEEGARRFRDLTRPLPGPRDPTLALVLVGVVLLGFVFAMLRRLKDPATRAALVRSMPAYRWVAHAFLAVGLLVILPLFVGALTSFFSGHGTDLHYAGLANYAEILSARGGELLGHGSFWLVLLVTVLWTVLNLALHVGIGVLLALLLNRPTLRLKGMYRVLLILPWAVPSYVTALSWKGMFHRQFGAVNALLTALGAEPVSFFAHFSTAFTANLVTNVWLGFPFMMVVTLGALSSIPKDLYEAAAVDGATKKQQFWRITAPLLVPALAPAVAMGAVWTFNMFNVVFLVSGGEPDGSTEILVSDAYRWAFTRSNQYGYAAAYAVLIFLILVLFSKAAARGLARVEEKKA